MKYALTICVLLFTVLSCVMDKGKTDGSDSISISLPDTVQQVPMQIESSKTLSKEEVDSITKELDIRLENGELYFYSYPNKTAWGGLNGYYLDKELVITSSKLSGEFGFSASRYYWHKGKMIKILITKGSIEWNKENTEIIREDKEDYKNPSYIIILAEKNYLLKRDNRGAYIVMTDTSWVDQKIRDGFESRRFYQEVAAEE